MRRFHIVSCALQISLALSQRCSPLEQLRLLPLLECCVVKLYRLHLVLLGECMTLGCLEQLVLYLPLHARDDVVIPRCQLVSSWVHGVLANHHCAEKQTCRYNAHASRRHSAPADPRAEPHNGRAHSARPRKITQINTKVKTQ